MYKDAYLESRVLTASPLDLVNMLYQHAERCVQEARKSLAAKDIPSRTIAICKAISIFSELRSSLDHTAGGQLSANLESLYEYMQKRLTDANTKQQEAPLIEVESLLQNLSNAWSAISQGQQIEIPDEEITPLKVGANTESWIDGFAAQAEFERPTSCWSA